MCVILFWQKTLRISVFGRLSPQVKVQVEHDTFFTTKLLNALRVRCTGAHPWRAGSEVSWIWVSLSSGTVVGLGGHVVDD